MMYWLCLFVAGAGLTACTPHEQTQSADDVIEIIKRVNNHWQANHTSESSFFWSNGVYHTGNMEAFLLTQDTTYLRYSEDWAKHNHWRGADSDNRKDWKYSYGESDDFVLFGDNQVCFQTYVDLFCIAPDSQKIARAREVMEYQMSTSKRDYWWWSDGLYMAMPLMTKLYRITKNELYLDKMYAYFQYTDSVMWDHNAGLYYRDAKYVYPKHKTINGKKDFWARGDGWVLAAFAKVLRDLPESDAHRELYLSRYRQLAASVAACQQKEGYWTRCLLDPQVAPGPETSGTALFTYGLLWGINNGVLPAEKYIPVVKRAWHYLMSTALQTDGTIGYVQPIGEKAVSGQVVDANSTSDFGVGAFLLAACEYTRFLKNKPATSVAEDDFVAYLFVYFTGNKKAQEAIHLGASLDGYSFFSLNGNQPIIASDTISSTGGVRDPHILRCEDDSTFYLVATDMVSANGWNSNRAMVLMKSTDLVNWTHTVVNIQEKFAHQDNLQRVWAPETIYDSEAKKYMIYWSMKYGDGPDVIYYAYANDNFTDIEGEPRQLFFPENGKSCIDGDIIYRKGIYHLFYKTEGHGNGLKEATASSLTSGQWTEYPDYKQQTTDAVEGAGVFKLIGKDRYILMYDVYGKGHYQFTETTDLQNFSLIDNVVTMNFSPRHGTVIAITHKELKRLINKWGGAVHFKSVL